MIHSRSKPLTRFYRSFSTGRIAMRDKVLNTSTINPAVLNVQYAVRGELALKADKYSQQLASPLAPSPSNGRDSPTPKRDLPFDKVVTANIGNPQQKGLDQQPITFWRQVISLLEYPDLFKQHLSVAKQIYPEDVIQRAKDLHVEIGSTGAYTHSKGVLGIRKRVAKFIEGESLSPCTYSLSRVALDRRQIGCPMTSLSSSPITRSTSQSLTLERDGYPADPESIYLTAGASAGVSAILSVALQKGDGCLIPIPQYPLYTATLAFVSATPIPYYLQEEQGWSMNHQVLIDGIKKAKADGTPIKALVIINPGNPTGGCLSESAIKEVIQLCYDERIVLMADEVYQNNIFDEKARPFISFKKVLKSMDKEVAEGVELVSFHSISKGVSGECGRRGGYYECVNISDEVMEQIYKMASVSLCPPVSGQVSRDSLRPLHFIC